MNAGFRRHGRRVSPPKVPFSVKSPVCLTIFLTEALAGILPKNLIGGRNKFRIIKNRFRGLAKSAAVNCLCVPEEAQMKLMMCRSRTWNGSSALRPLRSGRANMNSLPEDWISSKLEMSCGIGITDPLYKNCKKRSRSCSVSCNERYRQNSRS